MLNKTDTNEGMPCENMVSRTIIKEFKFVEYTPPVIFKNDTAINSSRSRKHSLIKPLETVSFSPLPVLLLSFLQFVTGS